MKDPFLLHEHSLCCHTHAERTMRDEFEFENGSDPLPCSFSCTVDGAWLSVSVPSSIASSCSCRWFDLTDRTLAVLFRRSFTCRTRRTCAASLRENDCSCADAHTYAANCNSKDCQQHHCSPAWLVASGVIGVQSSPPLTAGRAELRRLCWLQDLAWWSLVVTLIFGTVLAASLTPARLSAHCCIHEFATMYLHQHTPRRPKQ